MLSYSFFDCCWLELVGLISVSTGGWSGGMKDLVHLAMVFESFAVVLGRCVSLDI